MGASSSVEDRTSVQLTLSIVSFFASIFCIEIVWIGGLWRHPLHPLLKRITLATSSVALWTVGQLCTQRALLPETDQERGSGHDIHEDACSAMGILYGAALSHQSVWMVAIAAYAVFETFYQVVIPTIPILNRTLRQIVWSIRRRRLWNEVPSMSDEDDLTWMMNQDTETSSSTHKGNNLSDHTSLSHVYDNPLHEDFELSWEESLLSKSSQRDNAAKSRNTDRIESSTRERTSRDNGLCSRRLPDDEGWLACVDSSSSDFISQNGRSSPPHVQNGLQNEFAPPPQSNIEWDDSPQSISSTSSLSSQYLRHCEVQARKERYAAIVQLISLLLPTLALIITLTFHHAGNGYYTVSSAGEDGPTIDKLPQCWVNAPSSWTSTLRWRLLNGATTETLAVFCALILLLLFFAKILRIILVSCVTYKGFPWSSKKRYIVFPVYNPSPPKQGRVVGILPLAKNQVMQSIHNPLSEETKQSRVESFESDNDLSVNKKSKSREKVSVQGIWLNPSPSSSMSLNEDSEEDLFQLSLDSPKYERLINQASLGNKFLSSSSSPHKIPYRNPQQNSAQHNIPPPIATSSSPIHPIRMQSDSSRSSSDLNRMGITFPPFSYAAKESKRALTTLYLVVLSYAICRGGGVIRTWSLGFSNEELSDAEWLIEWQMSLYHTFPIFYLFILITWYVTQPSNQHPTFLGLVCGWYAPSNSVLPSLPYIPNWVRPRKKKAKLTRDNDEINLQQSLISSDGEYGEYLGGLKRSTSSNSERPRRAQVIDHRWWRNLVQKYQPFQNQPKPPSRNPSTAFLSDLGEDALIDPEDHVEDPISYVHGYNFSLDHSGPDDSTVSV